MWVVSVASSGDLKASRGVAHRRWLTFNFNECVLPKSPQAFSERRPDELMASIWSLERRPDELMACSASSTSSTSGTGSTGSTSASSTSSTTSTTGTSCTTSATSTSTSATSTSTSM